MTRELIVCIKNNRKFFSKAIIVFSLLFSLFSICFSIFFSYAKTLEEQKVKLSGNNYYEISEYISDDQLNEIFYGFKTEMFQAIEYSSYSKIVLEEAEVETDPKVLNFIDIRNNNNLLPTNLEKAYLSNGISICLSGKLPENMNEIALSYGTYSSMVSNSENILDPIDVIGKKISLFPSDSNEQITELKITGILNLGPVDLLENYNNIVVDPQGLENERKVKVKRIYIDGYDDIKQINERINALEVDDDVQYKGNQYGIYLTLQNFRELTLTIYYFVGIPLTLTIAISSIFMLLNYFKKQKVLFSEMFVIGYTNKKILCFSLIQLGYIFGIAFVVSDLFAILSLFIIKNIFKSMLINFNLDILLFFVASMVLLFVVLLFVVIIMLFIIPLIKESTSKFIKEYEE